MTVEAPSRRIYSDAEMVGALRAVDANKGYIKPTADALGIPAKTLSNWTLNKGKRAIQARNASLGHNEDLGIADRYLDIIIAAQDRTLEAIGSASAYQAALIGAISTDKRQLILGRPTSRTEAIRTRYVDGDALRGMANRVIDITPDRESGKHTRSGQPNESLAIPAKTKRRRIKKQGYASSEQVMQPSAAESS